MRVLGGSWPEPEDEGRAVVGRGPEKLLATRAERGGALFLSEEPEGSEPMLFPMESGSGRTARMELVEGSLSKTLLRRGHQEFPATRTGATSASSNVGVSTRGTAIAPSAQRMTEGVVPRPEEDCGSMVLGSGSRDLVGQQYRHSSRTPCVASRKEISRNM